MSCDWMGTWRSIADFSRGSWTTKTIISARRPSCFPTPTAEPGPLDAFVLNVVIATARNIRVENSIAQLEVAGSLSVGGTIAAPDFGGFITVQRDGTFNIGRNKFQVIQGRIDLTGFPLESPVIRPYGSDEG